MWQGASLWLVEARTSLLMSHILTLLSEDVVASRLQSGEMRHLPICKAVGAGGSCVRARVSVGGRVGRQGYALGNVRRMSLQLLQRLWRVEKGRDGQWRLGAAAGPRLGAGEKRGGRHSSGDA